MFTIKMERLHEIKCEDPKKVETENVSTCIETNCYSVILRHWKKGSIIKYKDLINDVTGTIKIPDYDNIYIMNSNGSTIDNFNGRSFRENPKN